MARIAIGDLQGCLDELRDLLQAARDDAQLVLNKDARLTGQRGEALRVWCARDQSVNALALAAEFSHLSTGQFACAGEANAQGIDEIAIDDDFIVQMRTSGEAR